MFETQSQGNILWKNIQGFVMLQNILLAQSSITRDFNMSCYPLYTLPSGFLAIPL